MRGLILAVLAAVLALACSSPDRAVVSAADVVDELAHRGDQIDAVAVTTCHAAELAAAHWPDLAAAAAKVAEVRAACDVAFKATDDLARAIAHVDAIFARAQRGEIPVEEVITAALAARSAFDQAQAKHDALKAYLEGK